MIFNENVDVGNDWKWVPYLYELLVEKNLNFERSKLTINGQKMGFVGHNRVLWDVFYRCQPILSPNMIVDLFEFMDEKLIFAPVCTRFTLFSKMNFVYFTLHFHEKS